MTSRTGNNGFTLIEIMAATAVLALGIVFIYQAYFVSLDSYDYYANYLSIAPWAEEKIWEAQNNLIRFADLGAIQTSGVLVNIGKRINWTLSSADIDGIKDKFKLFKIELRLSWKQGKRNVVLSRSAYALYEKE